MLKTDLLFKAAFEHSAICKLVYWPDGRLVYASQAFCRLLGYQASELMGLKLSALNHPADQCSEQQQLEQLLAGQQIASPIEKRFLNKQGESIWVQQHLTAFWQKRESSKTSELQCLLAEIQDIQSRKYTEAVQDTERKRLQMLEMMANLGSWQLHLSSGQYWLSDECCRIFGFEQTSRPESMRQALKQFNFVHPQDRGTLQQLLQMALQGSKLPFNPEGNLQLDFRIVRPDGVTRYLTAKGRPAYSPDGKLEWLTGFVMDITAFRLQEQMLAEANRLLAQQTAQLRMLASRLSGAIQGPLEQTGKLLNLADSRSALGSESKAE